MNALAAGVKAAKRAGLVTLVAWFVLVLCGLPAGGALALAAVVGLAAFAALVAFGRRRKAAAGRSVPS